jgi:acylphosphatase
MAGPTRTVHLTIEGRVQGVGYRVWTERKATSLGLLGWVRNKRDGTVEAVFQGAEGSVEAMIKVCRAGPPGAIVTRLETRAEDTDVFSGFEVRETE